MNRSFLQKLQPAPGEPPSPEVHDISKRSGEGLIREALVLVKTITNRRRNGLPDSDIPDVTQETGLRLWKWIQKFNAKSERMSGEEWRSFAAKSAFNEVKRRRTKLVKQHEVPLEDIPKLTNLTDESESEMEMGILVQEVWQAICRLSLYQRQALLLHSAELLIYLVQFGIEEQAIARAVSLNVEDLNALLFQMPLTDIEIAKLVNSGKRRTTGELAVRAIKKARYDARRKLAKLKG